LQNLGSTSDAVARRVSLRKTPNAILGPSSLPVVVAQPDKRLQITVLYWSGMTDRQSIMVHTSGVVLKTGLGLD